MRLVIAIGGNALLSRGEPLEAKIQQQHAKSAAISIAQIAQNHEVIIVHGNGPQVGLLALQAANYSEVKPYSLDILIAESQGMIGYFLQQEISNCLANKKIATLLTQIEVKSDDLALNNPTKPIGPIYNEQSITTIAKKFNWQIKKDGDYFRRVVPSPEPQQIIEIEVIKLLINQNYIVICAGGGGIPIIKTNSGKWKGIEAVIDKDLSAALLAIQLKADALIILSDVNYVEKNWNTAQAEIIQQTTPRQLRKLKFAKGSMAPKIEAVCRFVEYTGNWAAIGALKDSLNILQGSAGTHIKPF